jgi:hypothetical protein
LPIKTPAALICPNPLSAFGSNIIGVALVDCNLPSTVTSQFPISPVVAVISPVISAFSAVRFPKLSTLKLAPILKEPPVTVMFDAVTAPALST